MPLPLPSIRESISARLFRITHRRNDHQKKGVVLDVVKDLYGTITSSGIARIVPWPWWCTDVSTVGMLVPGLTGGSSRIPAFPASICL